MRYCRSHNLEYFASCVACDDRKKQIGTVKLTTDPDLLLAVEYGYKGAERGWNLDKTIAEFKKVMQ
jgi:hypothetical protein